MEKRVTFRSAWLPYALVAPQIAITVVFFFWPALQAVWYSFQLQDAFGLRSQFVGLQNFTHLFRDGNYLLVVIDAIVLVTSLLVMLEAASVISRFRKGGAVVAEG